MKFTILTICALTLLTQFVSCVVIRNGEGTMHFSYQTENGHTRTEDIKYDNTKAADVKDNEVASNVEYRGGYSFISDDGYEYTVLYKANKNGFQPYVTAKKIN